MKDGPGQRSSLALLDSKLQLRTFTLALQFMFLARGAWATETKRKMERRWKGEVLMVSSLLSVSLRTCLEKKASSKKDHFSVTDTPNMIHLRIIREVRDATIEFLKNP
jgi:hypothetical protein